MLNQFFYDWNTAIQSRVVVNETRNPAGVITMQETKFMFRNVEITMFSRIAPGSEKLPQEKRRWVSEMFVPSTNKIIPSVRYTSKARCAAEILAALVPGRAHEDRVEARNQDRQRKYLEKLYNARKEKLATTSFKPEDQEFILSYLSKNSVVKHSQWDDALVDILCKYHSYITGIGLDKFGIKSHNEEHMHIDRMYNTACQLISESFIGKNGLPSLTRGSISRNFLAPHDNIKYGIYVVRSGYSKIFDECTLSTKFMRVVKLIAEYYAHVTGVPVDNRIADIKAYRERQRERRHERAVKGPKRFHNNTGSVSTYSNRLKPVGFTIGDAFNNVLDTVVETSEKVKDDAKPTKKKNVSKKTVTPVTNGQINGKQLEKPATKSVDVDEIRKQQEAFAKDMMSKEASSVSDTDLPEQPMKPEIGEQATE